MKNRILLSFFAVALVVSTPTVRAEGPTFTLLTDTQLELVRTNCTQTKSNIDRIRANDGLVRVNLAREYTAISTKLMAPMNSRVALNKLNGIDITKTTVDFDQEIERFRQAYQKYEQTVSQISHINCQERPADFYTTIEQARYYRANVRKSVEKLDSLITQYKDQLMKVDLSPEKGEKL